MVLIMINSYKPSSLLTYSLYHRYATIGQWNIIRCGIEPVLLKKQLFPSSKAESIIINDRPKFKFISPIQLKI